MRVVFVILMAWFSSVNVMAQVIPVEPLPGLPQAISNNAVMLVERAEGAYLFETADWQRLGELPRGTMDHRGLLFLMGGITWSEECTTGKR